MSSTFSREALLDVAKASPSAVAKHDREAWMALFCREYSVEDPIGTRPHVPGSKGLRPLENFFNTFIAPNNIVFHVDQDIVSGDMVVRDLTIEIRMSMGIVVSVPMHVIYEMIDEHGFPKIRRLRAYWELIPMVKRVLRKDIRGVISFGILGFRMMRNLGINGTMEFAKGFRGIHRKGKDIAGQFVETVNKKDIEGLIALFEEKNEGIYFPASKEPASPASFCEQINTRLFINKILAAGYYVSFSFSSDHSKGVGFFKFNPKTKRIQSAQFYFE